MATFFELECRAYELREQYLGQLQSYLGTGDELPGDVQKIVDVGRELALKREDMCRSYGAQATQWFSAQSTEAIR